MLSLLYLLVYLFAGCVIIRALLPAQRPQVRVWLGLSLGLLLLMWLPALLAFAVCCITVAELQKRCSGQREALHDQHKKTVAR